jgi:hypothetical protein
MAEVYTWGDYFALASRIGGKITGFSAAVASAPPPVEMTV